MEDQTNCADPQFMNMLEACLRMEIETAEKSLASLKDSTKQLKVKVHGELQKRKEMKKRAQDGQENLAILTAAFKKLNERSNDIVEAIELMNTNGDDGYKIMQLEQQKYDDILKEYKNTWESYEIKYEGFPLAKVRKEAKRALEKIRVEKMMVEYKIADLEKIIKSQNHIKWLRTRTKIIEFAREMINNAKLKREYRESLVTLRRSKEDLKSIDTELSIQLQKRAEEEKIRAAKFLEKPLPKIMPPLEKPSIFVHNQGIREPWLTNYNSLDSLSVNTLMLESMCENSEESNETSKTSKTAMDRQRLLGNLDRSLECALNAKKTFIWENEQIVVDECREAASKPTREDENREAANKMDEVIERSNKRRSQETYEEIARTFRSERMSILNEEDMVEPEIKRSRSSKNNSQEDKETPDTVGYQGPTSGPRIIKIERVQYNPMIAVKMGNRNSVVENRNTDGDPSSMFTPSRYDYCDRHSEFSLSIAEDDASKGDKISHEAGSFHAFSELSNMTAVSITTNMEEVPESTAGLLQEAEKPNNASRYNFINIFKKNTQPSNLF